MFKEPIQRTETVLVMDTVTSALTKYWSNILEDDVTMLFVIVPSDLLVFAVPIWMRMPVIHFSSILWNVIREHHLSESTFHGREVRGHHRHSAALVQCVLDVLLFSLQGR